MSLDPLSAALDLGNTLIQRIFPDPAQANQAKLELMKLQQSGDLAQITGQLDINKIEAANSSIFVSGARPFIMWICGTGFGLQFIVNPLLTWGSILYGHQINLPNLDMGTLMTMLGGLLGLGGMRTVEKLNGVASK